MADCHEELINAGLELHEARMYGKALPIFERALSETPDCVSARYNLANTLHMLERHGEAIVLLEQLLATENEVFLSGCPLAENPEPFKVDTLFLMFLATLYHSESWDKAYPFAVQHVNARSDDVQSVFSDEYIKREMKSLKLEFQS